MSIQRFGCSFAFESIDPVDRSVNREDAILRNEAYDYALLKLWKVIFVCSPNRNFSIKQCLPCVTCTVGIKAHFDLLSGILFCGKVWQIVLGKIIETRGF